MRAGNQNCTREHDYFIADVAQVTEEGKIVINAICKSCGDLVTHSVKVTSRIPDSR